MPPENNGRLVAEGVRGLMKIEAKRASRRRFYYRHKDRILAERKERLRTDPVFKAAQDARRRRNYASKETRSIRARKHKYGLEHEQFLAAVATQENKCAICQVSGEEASKGTLFVDHDHVTGKLRGLVCGHCNAMMGMARDSAFVLMSAAHYLLRHNGIEARIAVRFREVA